MNEFTAWAGAVQARMEIVLEGLLPAATVAPEGLHDAMRYAVLGGGKRVRPLLVFGAGEVCGAESTSLERAAAAVELMHAYSLVHDDLPAMDDDDLRHGKPTVHVEFDEATALLVGDSLQTLAFQVLAETPVTRNAETQLELVALLARAAGSRGMAGGQAMDLDSTGKSLSVEELEFMHIHKTGALIRTSVLLGARCGTALADADLDALDHFGKRIGLAFQVVDDVLDAEESTATLGKTAGKDREANKPTYSTLLGTERARALAADLHAEALSTLVGFGARGERLRQIADFVLWRRF